MEGLGAWIGEHAPGAGLAPKLPEKLCLPVLSGGALEACTAEAAQLGYGYTNTGPSSITRTVQPSTRRPSRFAADLAFERSA